MFGFDFYIFNFQVMNYGWFMVLSATFNDISAISHGARLGKLQKGCTRLATASNKAYQLLAHGRWFSPSTPVSSTTKTGRHDIAEILLKVALSTKIKSSSLLVMYYK